LPFQILTIGEPVVSGAAGPFIGLGLSHTVSPFLVFSLVSTDLDPNTLNLKSQGKFVTVFFEITGVKSTDQIDPASLAITRINDQAVTPIPAEPKPLSLEDPDQDGVLELMVKFDRQALIDVLPVAEQVKVTMEGKLVDQSSFKVNGFIRTIQPGAIPTHDGGFVFHPSGAKIEVSDEALPQGGQLHIVKLSGVPQRDKDLRKRAAQSVRRNLVGVPYEFGPEGTTFAAPITITVPYDPASLSQGTEDNLQLAYWNPKTQAWEPLPSTVDAAAKVVRAQTDHFSLYQVVASAAETTATGAEFSLKEVYFFPNPAVGGAKPTLHVEVGIADSVTIDIYNIAGQKVHGGAFNGPPGVVNGRYAYEFVWNGHIPSGVYLYTIKAEKGGHAAIRAAGKCAVVR